MPAETKISSVTGLVPLLDQNLPKHQPNLTSAYRAKTQFLNQRTPFQRFKFSNQILDLNFQLSLPGMFGNGTLVDLLRFDKVVQARTKVPSKGPVRRAGD